MCDRGGRGESKVATSQGVPRASRNWKRQRMNSLLTLWRECGFADL